MTWVEPDKWYAKLAAFHAAAALFITDATGRVLLVKPNYRDHWAIPGGYVDQDESPDAAADRELCEELDLALPVGDLLVVDWASPRRTAPPGTGQLRVRRRSVVIRRRHPRQQR